MTSVTQQITGKLSRGARPRVTFDLSNCTKGERRAIIKAIYESHPLVKQILARKKVIVCLVQKVETERLRVELSRIQQTANQASALFNTKKQQRLEQATTPKRERIARARHQRRRHLVVQQA